MLEMEGKHHILKLEVTFLGGYATTGQDMKWQI